MTLTMIRSTFYVKIIHAFQTAIRANKMGRFVMQMAVRYLLKSDFRFTVLIKFSFIDFVLHLPREQASQRATLRPAFQPGVSSSSSKTEHLIQKKIPACQTCILCWREARTTHTIFDSRHIALSHPRFPPAIFLYACHVA